MRNYLTSIALTVVTVFACISVNAQNPQGGAAQQNGHNHKMYNEADAKLLLDFNPAPHIKWCKDRGIADWEIEKYIEVQEGLFLDSLNKNKWQKKLLPPNPTPQSPGQPCDNVDFEYGSFINWDCYVGTSISCNTVNMGGVNAVVAGRHSITNGPTFDAQVGGNSLPIVDPQGGIYSAKLGNEQTGAQAERIEQTFMVTQNTTSFTYRYAVVLNNTGGGHNCVEPGFKIDMVDANGNPITCAAYDVSYGAGIPGFQNYGNNTGIWKDWSTVNIDLTGYVNQNVTIRFTTRDCGAGGHYGYAYLDGSCLPFYIVASDTLCAGECIQLIAPPGAASYLWTGPGNANGAVTQIITVCQPGQYSVQSTAFNGCPNPGLYYYVNQYPDPVAAIIPNPVPCTLTINFQDGSTIPNNFNNTTITQWEWDFENDGTMDANTQNPSHTYNTPGNYTVLLAIMTANGCKDTITLNVAVFANPTAQFTAPAVCVGTPTVFTDGSTTPAGVLNQWAWDFDNDGNTDANAQNPTYTFPNAGTYPVKLTVTSNFGCSDDTIINVLVNPAPTAAFTALPVCQGNVTQFTDASTVIPGAGNDIVNGWSWDFGDGSPINNTQNPTHTYGAPGSYNVIFTVTTNNGCTNTLNQVVWVYPNPTADFTFNSPCLGQATTFTDISVVVGNGNNIAQWDWDFGDGTPHDNTQNPSHTYLLAGNYNVTLIVTTNNGCTGTVTHPVTVNPTANAVFISSSVCFGTATQFTDQSTVGNGNTITAWAWDFNGDNQTDDVNQNPTYTFPGPGTYNVMLTVTTNNGCQGQVTNAVTVHPIPVAAFTAPAVCLNGVMSFTDQSTITNGNTITGWLWDFGDGTPTSNLQNPTHTYAAVGTYQVTFTVTSNNGCSHTIQQNVTVNPLPTALFINTTECFGTATVFTDQSSVIGAGNNVASWAWDFNGDGTTDNTNQNPTYVFPTAGSYNTILTVTTNNGCTATYNLQVTVNPAPQPNFTATSVCLNNLTSFTDASIIGNGNTITGWDWDFGDGTPHDVTQNPSHMYTTAGVYQVKLTTTSNNGCPKDTTIAITVYPLPTAAFSAVDVCLYGTMSFTDASTVTGAGNLVNTWDWSFGDGSTDNTQNPTHLYAADGVYNVTLIVTTNNGCKDTITKQVMVYPNPATNFTGINLAGCGPVCASFTDATTITSGTITGWAWDFGDGSALDNTQNPSHCYAVPGTYSVTLTTTSDKGCSSTFVITDMIRVDPYPTALFTVMPQPTTIRDPKITFTDLSLGANKWHWDFGDVAPNDKYDVSDERNPMYNYGQPGTYETTLIVTNQFGCTDTTKIKVTIGPDYSFYVPSAFSPNGDGVNDGFNGKGEGIAEYEMYIYNRWGELLFKSESLNDNWDGTAKYRTQLCQQDVYVYKIKVKTIFGDILEYVGNVTLVR